MAACERSDADDIEKSTNERCLIFCNGFTPVQRFARRAVQFCRLGIGLPGAGT